MILQSTQESQTLAGSNRSSGGSLGVAIGAGQGGWGISVSASLNQGKGKESGDGLTNTETTVNAGNLISGEHKGLKFDSLYRGIFKVETEPTRFGFSKR